MISFSDNTFAAQQSSVIFATDNAKKPNCFSIFSLLELPFLQKAIVQIFILDVTQKKAFVEEDSKTNIFQNCITILMIQKIQRKVRHIDFFRSSNFPITTKISPHNYKLLFSLQGLNPKVSFYVGKLTLITSDLVHCIRTLKVLQFETKLLIMIFVDNQTHCSP